MHTRRHPKLRKKKGSYYADFYDRSRQPTRKWIALGTKNKRVAQRKLTRLDDDYMRGDFDPWTDPVESRITVTEAIEDYIEHRHQEDYDKGATDRRRRILEQFADTLPPETTCRQVTSDQVRWFARRPDLAQWSQYTYFARLSTFFGFCIDEGYLDQNPCSELRRPSKPRKKINYVTPEQLEQLCRAIESRNDTHGRSDTDLRWYADVLRFTAGSGLRLGELCALKWKDVDLDRGAIIVRSDETHRTKTGDERTVYVSPEAQAILERIADARGIADQSFVFQGPRSDRLSYELTSRYFRKYRKLADLPDTLTFHSLRKTYGTMLASGGVPLRTIQKMLGHSDISMTARTYADVMTDAARDQVRDAFK
jgi:integrase